MKAITTFLIIIFLGINGAVSQNTGHGNLQVHTAGTLKAIVRTGDISSRADLDTLKSIPHLFALGALENLSGEITIIDGKPYISQDIEDDPVIDQTWDHQATLLVYASVEKWLPIDIPDSVKTLEQLDAFVGKAAEANGLSPDDAFPFRVEGTADSFSWHIVKWKIGDMEHSHEKHKKSGLHGTMHNKDVEIIGFYSQHHQGIFTHHGTNVHAHVRAKDNSISGHLDELELGKDMVVKLPLGN